MGPTMRLYQHPLVRQVVPCAGIGRRVADAVCDMVHEDASSLTR